MSVAVEPSPNRPDSNPKFAVVAESPDWIVIDKPPHLQVHPSKPDGSFTLWHGLRELLAFEMQTGGQVSIINRLDRETSGLTLVCKTAAAARKFSLLMQARQIRKEYLAIVWGWLDQDASEIDAQITRQGDHEPSRIYLKQKVHPAGAPAQTSIRVERRFTRETSNGGRFSVVRVLPHTGRMHQIRVHLAHLGHPVVGDKIYGPNEENYLTFIETGWTAELAQSLLLPRHALHSAVLGIDAENLAWQSPLPPDLEQFVGPGSL
ncbi:MAG: rRNA synthase [Chthoniobacter sp.]|nr:rRNA synthase [Chthoniobacter sp.]